MSAYLDLELYGWQARYHYAHQRLTPLLSVRGVVIEDGDTLRVDALNTLSLSHPAFGDDQLSVAPKLYYSLHQSRFLGDSEPSQIQGDDNQDGLNETFLSGIIESFRHDALRYGGGLELHWQIADSQRVSAEWSAERSYLDRAEKLSNATLIGRAPIVLFPVQDVTDEFIASDIDRRLQALSLEYFWQMAPGWVLTLGGRQSKYSDFGASTDPRLALVYEGQSGWYSKLLYGSAFVPPSFLQLFEQTPTLTRFRRRGNPDLEASTIRTLEWLNGATFSPRLNGEITMFYSQTDNEIFYNASPGIERWQNGDSRTARGIEFSSTWRPHTDWQLRSALTVQNSEGIDSGIAADIHPHVRAHVGAYWTGNAQEWFADLNYFSAPAREKADARPELAAKTLVDINWRWRDLLPGADLSVSVYNLFDKAGADATPRAQGLEDDLPRAGREYWLALQYRWP